MRVVRYMPTIQVGGSSLEVGINPSIPYIPRNTLAINKYLSNQNKTLFFSGSSVVKPILVAGDPFSRHFLNHNLEAATDSSIFDPNLSKLFPLLYTQATSSNSLKQDSHSFPKESKSKENKKSGLLK